MPHSLESSALDALGSMATTMRLSGGKSHMQGAYIGLAAGPITVVSRLNINRRRFDIDRPRLVVPRTGSKCASQKQPTNQSSGSASGDFAIFSVSAFWASGDNKTPTVASVTRIFFISRYPCYRTTQCKGAPRL